MSGPSDVGRPSNDRGENRGPSARRGRPCLNKLSAAFGESEIPGMLHPPLGGEGSHGEETMMISVAFALAVAMSAKAMSPAPLLEPDTMITQVRKARWVTWPRAKCWDPNQRVINGICVFDARPVPPAEHMCVAWWDGVCVEHYGTLKGWRKARVPPRR